MISSPSWVSISNAAISKACVHDGVINDLTQGRFFSNHFWQYCVYFPLPHKSRLFMASRINSFSNPVTHAKLNGITITRLPLDLSRAKDPENANEKQGRDRSS